MGFKAASRVRETSTTTGTGTYTLAGAATGYQTFGAGIGTGNTCHYCATDGTGWEVGIGTVGSGTLARTTILASSNGGAAVSWTAGTRTIICSQSGEQAWLGKLKVGNFTRDTATASGTQQVTGVGFTPKAVIFLASVASSSRVSVGASIGTAHFSVFNNHGSSADTWSNSASFFSRLISSVSDIYDAAIASLDADGFTVSWTRTGTPTGTVTVHYLALA